MFDSCKSWEGSVSKPEKRFDLLKSLTEQIGKEPSKIIKDLQGKNGGKTVTEMCNIYLSSGESSDERIAFLVNNNVISSEKFYGLYQGLLKQKEEAEKQFLEHEQNYSQFDKEKFKPGEEDYAEYQRDMRSLHSGCEMLRHIVKQRDEELKEQEKYLAKQLRPGSRGQDLGRILTRRPKTRREELSTRFNELSSQRAKVTELILDWRQNSDQLGKFQAAERKLSLCLSTCGYNLDDLGPQPGSDLYKAISNYCDQTKEFIKILSKISAGYTKYEDYINSKKAELAKFANVLKEQKELEEKILRYKLDKEILDKNVNDAWLNHQKVQEIEQTREENRLHFEIERLIPTDNLQSAWNDIDSVPNPKKYSNLLEIITNRMNKEYKEVINELREKNRGKPVEEMYKIHLTNGAHSDEHIKFLTKNNNELVNVRKLDEMYNELLEQKKKIDEQHSKHEQDHSQFYEKVFKPAFAAYVAYHREVHRLYSGCETFGRIAKQIDREAKERESQIKENIDQLGRESRVATKEMWRLLSGPKAKVEELSTKFNEVSSQRAKVTERILGWDDLSGWPWQKEENSPLNKLQTDRDKLELCLSGDGERSSRDSGHEPEAMLYNKISDYCDKVKINVNLLKIIHKMQRSTKEYIYLEKAGLTQFVNILKKEKEWKEKIWRYRLEGKILGQNLHDTWLNYRTCCKWSMR